MSVNNSQNRSKFSVDELDINLLFRIILRNKIFIGSLTALSFLFFCLYSLSKSRIWEGRFDIVLNITENNLSSLSPEAAKLAGLENTNNNLKTQVSILKSSSVLMPVFESLNKLNKRDSDLNTISNFSSWKNSNLSVILEKNTAILRIAYRDKDKKNILPVLKNISLTYQDYSGKNKRRAQALAKDYLKKQIIIFKEKSSKTLKAVQEFAIKEDLFVQDSKQGNFNISDPLYSFDLLISNIDIEKVRAKAANDIRKINEQIKKIEEIKDDPQKLQYIGSTIPALINDELPQKLTQIEEELLERRSKYTENDKNIQKIIEKRKLLIELLRNRSIGILKANKVEAEARMLSAIRPKEVLLKYKELLREAQRDESTLVSLENKLRSIQLEEAKISDPWELITKPTLLEYPVAPSRKRIGFFGLIFGFCTGTLIAFIKEKISGKLYDKDSLVSILNAPILETLKIEGNNLDMDEKILFLKEYFYSKNGSQISFISCNPITKDNLESIKSLIADKESDDINFKFFTTKSNLKDLYLSDINLLFVKLEQTDYKEIYSIKKRLEILKINLSGLILIETL